MKKSLILVTLLFFPMILHAIEYSVEGFPDLNETHFFAATISAGWLFGPDFVDTEESPYSFGGDILFGRIFFFGADFARNKMTFTDTKFASGASGNFYILDGVAGVSLDFGFSRWFLGAGAGGYLCNYENVPNDPDFTGFAMNFFWGMYLKYYKYCNLGIIYKRYALKDAGWYSTFGALISISIEDINLL